MKLLLIGKNGQVGWEAQRTLSCLGEVTALGHDEIDLAHPENLPDLMATYQPDVVVNAAAYNAVDRAETDTRQARLVNAIAPGILADLAKRQKAVFIHFSSDYIFDGTKTLAYTELDDPNPINAYGKTKLDGENAVINSGGAYLILRTGWVYSMRRDSFVNKVLKWGRENDIIRVVSDQVGSPTWSRLLAEICAQLLSKGRQDVFDWVSERSGVYNLAGSGSTSRFEWAESILEFGHLRSDKSRVKILPVLSSEFPTPAKRPLMTALDCSRFLNVFGIALPNWRSALKMAMESEHDI